MLVHMIRLLPFWLEPSKARAKKNFHPPARDLLQASAARRLRLQTSTSVQLVEAQLAALAAE